MTVSILSLHLLGRSYCLSGWYDRFYSFSPSSREVLFFVQLVSVSTLSLHHLGRSYCLSGWYDSFYSFSSCPASISLRSSIYSMSSLLIHKQLSQGSHFSGDMKFHVFSRLFPGNSNDIPAQFSSESVFLLIM